MACKICGRANCTASFHSFERQEHFSKYELMDTYSLIRECMDKDDEIEDLKRQIEELLSDDE